MKKYINIKNILGFLLINLILLFFLPVSPIYPNYNSCLEDTGIYQLVAREMVNGKSLYTEIFDHKGPFIFFIYLLPGIFVEQTNIILFIFDLLILNISFYFIYKTIKIKTGNIFFVLTILFTFICFNRSFSIVIPENIMFLTVSYLNYWVLSKQYLNPTKTQLIICGVLTGIIFWMKYSLCVYIGIIYLFFIFAHIKNKTFNYKYILMPLIGFLIPTGITLGYFIYNNNLSDLINVYFLLNTKYGAVYNLEIDYILIVTFLVISIFLFACVLKNKKEEFMILISYFVLFIVSFILTGKNYYYYYTPFAALIMFLPFLFNVEKFKKIIFIVNIICALVLSVILIVNYLEVSIASESNPSKLFYEIAGEDINDSIVLFTSDVQYLKYSDNLENKYFFSPSLTYEQYPEIWDEMYRKTLDAEYEYIFFTEMDNNGLKYPFVYNGVFGQSDITMKKATDIYYNVKNNYDLYKGFKYRTFVLYYFNKEYKKFDFLPNAHMKFSVYKKKK